MVKKNSLSKIIIFAVLSLCFVIGFIVFVCNKSNGETKVKADQMERGSDETSENITMFQAYEWNTNRDGQHWNRIANMANKLDELGFNSVWLPPAYKGMLGVDDTGYNPYDLYDLGEFYGNNINNTIRTRYGTKDQYLNMIDVLHSKGLKVYADIVLNHKAGGEKPEEIYATEVSKTNRNQVLSSNQKIQAYTIFNFDVHGEKSRNNKYSSFKWDARCFDAVDWDCFKDAIENNSRNSLYLFNGKSWDNPVDSEYGNYDYLTNLDVDFDNKDVVNEYMNWGEWYTNIANLDGFRLDAVKHIKFSFFKDWLREMRDRTGKDLYSVAEYLDGDMKDLSKYMDAVEGTTDIFDFPQWYKFRDVSKGPYDLRNLFKGTLSEKYGDLAVKFVDNHDTQPGKEPKENLLEQWFKAASYCSILTRKGKACVFYGDYFGTNPTGEYPETSPSIQGELETLLKVRKDYAYGEQVDYLVDPSYIGWVRKGDNKHENSGLASLVCTNEFGASINMNVGREHAGEVWYDVTGSISDTVTIDSNGNATFSVKGKKNGNCYAVWIKK